MIAAMRSLRDDPGGCARAEDSTTTAMAMNLEIRFMESSHFIQSENVRITGGTFDDASLGQSSCGGGAAPSQPGAAERQDLDGERPTAARGGGGGAGEAHRCGRVGRRAPP